MSKASRHLRNCPAVTREITSGECGENRGSNYQCPADCPHNPWSPENYEEGLEIDTRLSNKMLDRHKRENAAGHSVKEIAKQFPSPIKDVNAFYCWLYYFQRDAQGRTFVERWEKDRFQGLNNDEWTLFRHLAGMRPTVIEAQRVLDAQSFEAIDLFGDPARRFVVRDMSLTPRVGRFSAFLMWLAPLPHYCRLIGQGSEMMDVQDFAPDGVLWELARHLGAPEDRAALHPWLAGHFEKISDAHFATAQALRRRSIEQLDAKYCKTIYKPLAGARECVRRIASRSDVMREEPLPAEMEEGFTESFTWLEGELEEHSGQPDLPTLEPLPHAGGKRSLGRMLVGPERIRIEASSRARNAALRAHFERAFAGAVEFTGERVEDLGAQLLQGDIPPDISLVPPTLLAQARQFHIQSSIISNPARQASPEDTVADLTRLHQQSWMDTPVPALNGKTPRLAAADPVLRPKLLQLARKLVNSTDKENMRDGGDREINWLLEELGLREIIFDAPRYEAPPPGLDQDFEGRDDDSFDIYPEPPRSPLSESEFDRRMKALEEADPASFIDEMRTEFSDVVEASNEILDEFLEEREKTVMLTVVAQACFLISPPGTKRSRIDDARFDERFDLYLDEMLEITSGESPGGVIEEEAMEDFLQKSRQPEITRALSYVVLDCAMAGPRKKRTKVEALPLMLAYTKALVDELDCTAQG